MSRNLEEAQRWLSQAQYDLQAAQVNEQNGIYAWACFLCQQAAEKALKAFLYAQGQGPVIGHSSFRLAQECTRSDPKFDTIVRACKTLDGYHIPTRYPNGLPGGIPHEVYDEIDAAEALDAARAVMSLIVAKISAAAAATEETAAQEEDDSSSNS